MGDGGGREEGRKRRCEKERRETDGVVVAGGLATTDVHNTIVKVFYVSINVVCITVAVVRRLRCETR